LSGQVNCETLGSRPRGGIGGLLDFARAARVSDGGRGITVLASTASGGRVSRIVPQLSGPATLGRADVDAVVTEHGVAHLRDMSLAERARRLIAVAAPQHRETLLAQLHTMTQGAA
jgi:acetyl-CoA hydrolase